MLTILLLLFGATTLRAQEFVIITLNSEIANIRASQIKMLYRGRLQHVNGTPIRLMDLPRSSKYRKQFYSTLLNKSPSQMSEIWARQTFSGKAIAPTEVADESDSTLINWLNNNENGIAYVPIHLTPEDVYVIYRFP